MNIFKKIANAIAKVLQSAAFKGLTLSILKQAEDLVKVAASKHLDDAQRREWVVAQLVAKGIPESIARFAVELAVQALKAKL